MISLKRAKEIQQMKKIIFSPIGIIRSPFNSVKGTPIQPAAASGIPGTIELDEKYRAGLRDIEGFSHLILLYHFHLSESYDLLVKPFLDNQLHGLFSTRAPRRPNPIGLSVVRLMGVEGNLLHVMDVDIVDGTPLLDVKPYVMEFDVRQTQTQGWITGKAQNLKEIRADDRFEEKKGSSLL
ncbi:tRNA (N6-threonylcarbamoyladenosine(37)-N6)-methyltransferase TrmO [Desulforhabdus amnigena]|jgi:tRNA-Thr(GGU) m(6)t(6)A37 methyltransferase TsaA|uniref:tRNA (N6-threonylcarbamoyladenosine(37)-N6)-methyltransferase TrmO n=2 Tax=Desulforhabdus amnigena TaxID=40218 RepID=A0A9W6FS36_9BACT|nr:tRNA (N6-threonylcarbamoyladenosine(37)-N6)-methyltransferase TrmO [Desulforhabdus amnigena]